jgi:hypothetical protein
LNEQDDPLLRDLMSLGDEPVDMQEPDPVQLSPTVQRLSGEGFFDELASEQQGQRAAKETGGYFDSIVGGIRSSLGLDDQPGQTTGDKAADIFKYNPLGQFLTERVGQKAVTPGGFSEVEKGIVRGFAGTREMFGAGIEQYGKTLGSDEIAGYGTTISREAAPARSGKLMAPAVRDYSEIRKEKWFSDTADYLAAKFGEGVGNMAGVAAFYGAGGGIGGTGFLYTISVGEVRRELQDVGITDEKTLAQYSYGAGLVIAALERVFPEAVRKQLTAPAKKAIARQVAGTFVRGTIAGGAKEGITEALQEGVEIVAATHALQTRDQPSNVLTPYFNEQTIGALVSPEGRKRILEAGISGAVPGATFGAMTSRGSVKATEEGGEGSPAPAAPSPAPGQTARVEPSLSQEGPDQATVAPSAEAGAVTQPTERGMAVKKTGRLGTKLEQLQAKQPSQAVTSYVQQNAPAPASAPNLPSGVTLEVSTNADLGQTNVSVVRDGAEVGRAYVRDRGQTLQFGQLNIERGAQRQGIGTAVQEEVERQLGKPFVPDVTLSEAEYKRWHKYDPIAVADYERTGVNTYQPRQGSAGYVAAYGGDPVPGSKAERFLAKASTKDVLDLYPRFRDVLASDTPSTPEAFSQALGVSEQELQPLIDRAVEEGLLRVNARGIVRRTAKAKEAGSRTPSAPATVEKVAPLSEQGQPAQREGDRTNVAADVSGGLNARTLPRLPSQPASPSLSIPSDIRIDRLVEQRESEFGRAIPQVVVDYAVRIEDALGSPQFDAILAEIKTDKIIFRKDAHDLAAVLGVPVAKSATKEAAFQKIEGKHREALRQRQEGDEFLSAVGFRRTHEQPIPATVEAVRRAVDRMIKQGEPVKFPDEIVNDIHAAAEPMLAAVPDGVTVTAVSRIEPYRGGKHVRVTLKDRRGKEYRANVPADAVLSSRAFAIPDIGVIGIQRFLPRRYTLQNPIEGGAAADLNGVEFDRGVIAELGHEIVHVLRVTGRLSGQAWSRLLAHGAALGLLDGQFGTYLKAVGDPLADRQRDYTTREVYEQIYAGRSNFQEIMDQEAVTHMVEWWLRGLLTPQEIEPVRDLIDRILSGEMARAPAASPVDVLARDLAAIGAKVESRELDERGLFSPSLEAAKRIRQEVGTVQQMRAQLLSAGAKPKELEAVGFDKAFPDPNAKVTRGEIEALLRENRLQLGEQQLVEAPRIFTQSGEPEQRERYGNYSTPGGIPGSYREVVVTLPTDVDIPQGDTPQAIASRRQTTARGVAAGQIYTSSHWPGITNPLLHYRVKDFSDVSSNRPAPATDGSVTQPKVRVLDEMQSDWAQRARDQGTRDPNVDLSTLRVQLDEATTQRMNVWSEAQTLAKANGYTHADLGDGIGATLKKMRHDGVPGAQELTDKMLKVGNDYLDLSSKYSAAQQGVPSAPYISSTSDWVDLGLKQALIDAARDPSVSRFAWAPGKVQADRYGLEKEIQTLVYVPETQTLIARPKDGRRGFQETVAPDNLSDYVGKEVASKLLAQPLSDDTMGRAHVLGGQDIRMGGEGMKSFYGDFNKDGSYNPGILGQRLLKLVKSLDPKAAKIEPTELNTGKPRVISDIAADAGHRGVLSRNVIEQFAPAFEAEKAKGYRASVYPSIEITPELRAELLGGQPLFALGGRDVRSASMNSGPSFMPQFEEALPDFLARLNGYLIQALPPDVAVRITDRLFSPDGAELYGVTHANRRLIEIALSTRGKYDPARAFATAKHETFHALRQLGLFKNSEWALLIAHAKKTGVEQKITIEDAAGNIQRGLDHYRRDYTRQLQEQGFRGRELALHLEEYLDQELVAKMAEDWSIGRGAYPTRIAALLGRIKAFFEAVWNAMSDLGFQTVDDVFQRAFSGEIAGRQPYYGRAAPIDIDLASLASLKRLLPFRDRYMAWKLNRQFPDETTVRGPLSLGTKAIGQAARSNARGGEVANVEVIGDEFDHLAANANLAGPYQAAVDLQQRERSAPQLHVASDRRATPESFFDERVEVVDGATLTDTDIYEAYLFWAEEKSVPAVSLDEFRRALDDMGVGREKRGGRMRYVGIALRTPEDTDFLAAIASRSPPLQMGSKSVTGLEKPERSLSDLVGEVTDALGLTVRHGRLSPGLKASAGAQGGELMGQFGTVTGVVRVKIPNDLQTLAHEGGHALEVRPSLKADLDALKARHANELTASLPDLSEGFAEFFRTYLTNPQAAQASAPQFFADFEDLLDAKEPGMLEAMEAIQIGVEALANASPFGIVMSREQSSVKPGTLAALKREIADKGWGNTISDRLYGFYTAYFDGRHPMKRAVRFLLQTAADNMNLQLGNKERLVLKAIDDPYKLWRLSEHAKVWATSDLQNGIRQKGDADPTGPSFRDALIQAFGGTSRNQWTAEKAEAFSSYLRTRRILAEFERFDAGERETMPDLMISRDIWDKARLDAEMAYPEFSGAADTLYQFNRNLLKLKFDNGFLTPELYQELLGRKDYVPLNRVMDDGGPSTLTSARGANKRKMIQQQTNSSRDFINTLELIAQDVYATRARIALNDVIRAMDRLARAAGPGGGKIAERIPAKDMKSVRDDVREVLRTAAKQQGLSQSDMDGLVDIIDDLFDQNASVTIFRATDTNERGEPVVYLWENGERIPIRLGDDRIGKDIFDGLAAFGIDNAEAWLDALSLGAQVFRFGVTKAPSYILVNFLRDQLATWALSRDYIPYVTGAKGAGQVMADSPAAQRYKAFAGMAGIEGHLIESAAQKRDALTLRRKGFSASTSTWKSILRTMELTEAATRVGHFDAAYRRAIADGFTAEEAGVEAAYAAHDVLDFSRRGSKMIQAARIVAFLNSALQALDASRRTMSGERDIHTAYRELASPYLKAATGNGPLSVAEKEALPNSARVWVKLSMIGMIGVAFAALYRDDDEYEEFNDYMKATHWFFKLGGTWWRIPKPFELAVLSNAFEAGFDAYWRSDERALVRFLESMRHTMLPPAEVQGLAALGQLAEIPAAIWGHYVTKDPYHKPSQSAVPDHLKKLPPELQFTAYTSELGRLIGSTLNWSPAEVDRFITNTLATKGRDLLALSDQVLPYINQKIGGVLPGVSDQPRADKPLEDWWMVSRFTRLAYRSSLSGQEFWKQMSQDGGAYTRAAAGYKYYLDQGKTNPSMNREARDFIDRLSPDEKAFAILEGNFKEGEQDLHPLNRARQVLSVSSGIRKDMVLGRLVKQESEKRGRTPEEIVLSPSVQKSVNEILEDIGMREARNALIVIRHPGWENKSLMETGPLIEELQKAAPDVAKEYEYRLTHGKNKVYAFEAVKDLWPQARDRILSEGEDAKLYDLKGKASTYKLFGNARARSFGVQVPGFAPPPGMMRLGVPPEAGMMVTDGVADALDYPAGVDSGMPSADYRDIGRQMLKDDDGTLRRRLPAARIDQLQ